MSESAPALSEDKPCVLRVMPEQKIPSDLKIGALVTVRDTARRGGIDFSLIEWKRGSMWIWLPSSCIGQITKEAAA